jgi:hypothetical protein
MSNNLFCKSLLSGWFTIVTIAVVWSLTAGATLSTSALLVAIGIAPVVVMLLIGVGAPPPTVAELLYAVDAKDGR